MDLAANVIGWVSLFYGLWHLFPFLFLPIPNFDSKTAHAAEHVYLGFAYTHGLDGRLFYSLFFDEADLTGNE